MTLKTLLEGFRVLEVLKFPNPPDMSVDLNKKIWMNVLKNLTDEDFERAINIISRTNKFFPTPSEIIEAANEGKMLSASEALQMLDDEITRVCGVVGVNPGPMTPVIWKVVNRMGGDLNVIWKRTDRSYVQREFIEIYNQILTSEKMALLGENKKLID